MTTSPATGALPTHRRLVRLGRAIRRTLLALVIAVVAIVIAGLPVYVFPPQGDPTGADLVYVIGPPQPQRLELAAAIRDTDGHVPLLISVSDSRAGRGDSSFDADAVDECRQAGATCTTPEPFTTAGEARLLTAYIARQPAAETVVITYTPHVARTRYIFAKCYPGDVTVVGVDTPMTPADWAFQYAYQTAAFVKAWITPCP
ncbi:YdcF family protein [Microbacterium hydrothermale]|uniref:YdcF family protein n=1 Tax=Microbacterium hydrothermale TaxID=857427 RepID=UPI0010A8E450|nr:YdcF family protein [Microbacterium hydrothermale]